MITYFLAQHSFMRSWMRWNRMRWDGMGWDLYNALP